MLKFTNDAKTAANFNGVYLTLDKSENWSSISDVPTREAVLAWLAAGNKPVPADPPLPPVLIASKYKFRLALNRLGLRKQVEDAVAASNDQDLKDAWNHADEYRSDDPLALGLGYALGKTKAEIYAVFELANTL